MTELIRVSKAGIDVLGTSIDPNDYIFSSSYNTLKYFQSGTVAITVGSISSPTRTDATITHNIGYYPFYMAYVNISGNANYYVPLYGSAAVGGKYFKAEVYCGTSQLFFTIDTNNHSGTETYVCFYKIFRNNLGL